MPLASSAHHSPVRDASLVNTTAIKRSELHSISKSELMHWLNTALRVDYTSVTELGDGCAYAQIIDAVFPDVVPLHKVKFNASFPQDKERNLIVVRDALKKIGCEGPNVDVKNLLAGKYAANNDFTRWLFAVVNRNCPGVFNAYDARARRNRGEGEEARDGAPRQARRRERVAADAQRAAAVDESSRRRHPASAADARRATSSSTTTRPALAAEDTTARVASGSEPGASTSTSAAARGAGARGRREAPEPRAAVARLRASARPTPGSATLSTPAARWTPRAAGAGVEIAINPGTIARAGEGSVNSSVEYTPERVQPETDTRGPREGEAVHRGRGVVVVAVAAARSAMVVPRERREQVRRVVRSRRSRRRGGVPSVRARLDDASRGWSARGAADDGAEPTTRGSIDGRTRRGRDAMPRRRRGRVAGDRRRRTRKKTAAMTSSGERRGRRSDFRRRRRRRRVDASFWNRTSTRTTATARATTPSPSPRSESARARELRREVAIEKAREEQRARFERVEAEEATRRRARTPSRTRTRGAGGGKKTPS